MPDGFMSAGGVQSGPGSSDGFTGRPLGQEFARLQDELARQFEKRFRLMTTEAERQSMLNRKLEERQRASDLLEKYHRDYLDNLKAQAEQQRRLADASRQAVMHVQDVTRAFVSLATGSPLAALGQLSGMLLRAGERQAGAAASRYEEARRLQSEGRLGAVPGRGTGGTGGAGGGGGAALAMAGPAGAAVGALVAVGEAAKAVTDKLLELSKSASPHFAGAWNDATAFLTASIGRAIIPAMIPLGAALVRFAQGLNESRGSVSQFGAVFTALVTRFAEMHPLAGQMMPGWMRSMGRQAMDVAEGDPGMAVDRHWSENENEPQILSDRGRREFRRDRNRQNARNDPMQRALDLFVRSMEQTGPPAQFEGVTAAFNRIQQYEAGATDLQREQANIIREIRDTVQGIYGTGQEQARRPEVGAGVLLP